MQYEEFVQEMHTRSQEALKKNYKVREEETLQCNDTRDRKLVFMGRGKHRIQTTSSISMKGFFEMYEFGIPLEKCEKAGISCSGVKRAKP